NRAGLGVRILLENDQGIQIREVSAGHGVGCAGPLVQHFGLGASTSANLQAYFPGSQNLVAAEATAGQTIVIHEDGSVEAR
ncbi:MAG: ASPIC/UnbV domain-containing protein, partial [Myxococcota bacterium]|nr:ASPIC/UnbV domain-containing protein [Myxococcota bacterium]